MISREASSSASRSRGRSLVHEPPLLLADEPPADLDYIQVEKVLVTLRELAGPERVIVVSTHDPRIIPIAPNGEHLVLMGGVGGIFSFVKNFPIVTAERSKRRAAESGRG